MTQEQRWLSHRAALRRVLLAGIANTAERAYFREQRPCDEGLFFLSQCGHLNDAYLGTRRSDWIAWVVNGDGMNLGVAYSTEDADALREKFPVGTVVAAVRRRGRRYLAQAAARKRKRGKAKA
jgi:hypothetical protein